MPKYSFRFNEVTMNQVWFTADNVVHAHELMKQCEDEEINVSDLPDAEERNRGKIGRASCRERVSSQV
jgi:hypothetical protein